MTPRPRKVSDEEVFGAVHRVMSRVAPAQLTLSAIAAEAGVTAGALVQRFGSKRRLLLTLMTRVADATGEMFAGLRASHPSPLGALRSYAECVAQMGESPGGLAHHLGYLQMDLTDPEFHRQVRRQARAARAEVRRLLEDAVEARELVTGTDTGRLARTVEAIVGGSLLAWAFHRDGRPSKRVCEDLDSVLAPYVATRRGHPSA